MTNNIYDYIDEEYNIDALLKQVNKLINDIEKSSLLTDPDMISDFDKLKRQKSAYRNAHPQTISDDIAFLKLGLVRLNKKLIDKHQQILLGSKSGSLFDSSSKKSLSKKSLSKKSTKMRGIFSESIGKSTPSEDSYSFRPKRPLGPAPPSVESTKSIPPIKSPVKKQQKKVKKKKKKKS